MVKVAVGIIRQNGKVLVCQRKQAARYGLKWEFPGGKLDEVESAAEGLKRELREELGVEAEVGELYHRQEYTYPDRSSFEVLYYSIPSYRGLIQNLAFETIRWIPERDLVNTDMLEGNQEVVKKIIQETTTPISPPYSAFWNPVKKRNPRQRDQGGDKRGGRA